MIRRPPRSTQSRSSAASDVYKRQVRVDPPKEKQEALIEILEKVSPGSELREAVDRILRVGSGALIVVCNLAELRPIMSGGFNIDCEFTAPRLYELAKMDGAVVVDKELRSICLIHI